MHHFHALVGALLLATVSASPSACYSPEPSQQICYTSSDGGTPQNVSLQEITYIAGYLRYYGEQKGNPAFYTMGLPDANNCSEWEVTVKGTTLVLAKLVGQDSASVLFDDIATTIDGGLNATDAQKAASLEGGCGVDGGQMGVLVNGTDARYQQPQFTNGTYTNQGIVIKIVRNPGT